MHARIVTALGLAFLLAAPADAQGADDPLTPEERAWLDQNGPIRYAPDPDYPPFEFVEDGEVKGINLDFLNRMSRNLDIEFEVVVLDNWTAVLEAMQAREVHMVGSLAQTEEREAYMDFIGPYMTVGEVFYVNTARDDLRAVDDLSGKRVAVVQDYAAGEWLAENRPDLEQVPVPDMLSGLEAVSTGTVDAFFENVPVAGYHIRERSINNIRILGEPLYYSPANWGVLEDEPVLHGIVQKGLASIPLGEQTDIFEYWSGYDLGVQTTAPEGPLFSPVALTVVTGLALAVVAGGAWTVTLRRAVRSRTRDLRENRDRLQEAKEELENRVRARSRELQLLVEREGHVYETLERQAQEALWSVDQASWDLLNRYHGILKPDTRDAVARVRSEVWRLAERITETADTARTEDGASGGPVPLRPLLEEAARQREDRHGTRVEVSCPEDLALRGSRETLRRLAGHLASHAAGAAPHDPRISVEQGEDGAVLV
ncbi:MAG TPA: transporter substrate-binding domain-containing protein, partial [Longimicrobiales bacterium]|nr:transporter substrate-binding domain-containing protein [Longimicrobiales bacterium]